MAETRKTKRNRQSEHAYRAKARVLAARRSTSISGMLAEQIESLVDRDEAEERASASAIARMERGLRLGARPPGEPGRATWATLRASSIPTSLSTRTTSTRKPKYPIARKLLVDPFLRTRSLLVSPQVLQEFYVNVTRKIAKPLTKRAAREIVEDFSVWCIDTTATDVAAAFRIEDESKISFLGCALICASALKSGANVILSEDMSNGQKIAGIEVRNPFKS